VFLKTLLIQVSAHVRRIEAVEKDLKALSQGSASKDDISKVRAETKKLLDGLHVGMYSVSGNDLYRMLTVSSAEFLDLRSHVWGIRESLIDTFFMVTKSELEQDLQALSKKESTSVRI
jgi:hypothetical protein